MKKRLALAFALLLTLSLCTPALAAPIEMTAAYYGDSGACRMTAGQARAFAQVIEDQQALLTQYGGSTAGYGALIDLGNGIPALFYAGGQASAGQTREDGCTWSGAGSFGIWLYENGRAVQYQPPNTGLTLALFPGGLFVGGSQGGDGHLYDGRVYPIRDGVISSTPDLILQADFETGTFSRNGAPLTGEEFTAAQSEWDPTRSLAGHSYTNGAEGTIWGMTRTSTLLSVLDAYAAAVGGEDTPPEETAPEESAPEETPPEETTPEETPPEETAPEETTPEETAPEETAPEETTPEETTPEETTPEETTPEETAPEETPPEETAPEETAPEETAPEETAPEEAAPEETAPEETAPEETAPEEATPTETAPEETPPEEPTPEADEEPVVYNSPAMPFVWNVIVAMAFMVLASAVVVLAVFLVRKIRAGREEGTP